MKRILSLVLAMVMVLGSFSAVFAAEQTAAEKAGAFLQDAGVLQGNASGDLKLDADLKRRDAVVLLSRLMDKEEEAKEFPSKDLAFNDITDPYYTGFVAWAVANGIVNGKSATKFDPNGDLEARDFATMLLRALGHDVTGDAYTVALETAKELGLLEDVAVENETTVTRGTMAVMTFNTLGTPVKGSTETLADKLGIEMPAPEVSTDIEITAAKAVSNNKVEVKVKAEVEASVADFVIVKKGTTTAVEVKDVVKESAKVFVLETEALTSGTSYTVKSNGISLNFTGIAADKTAPTVKSAKGVDTNTFEVEFSDVMNQATATKVENYTFDKDLKVVSAELSGSRKVVTLTVDAAKRNTTYKLTIENLTNSDNVAMKKFSQNVRAIEYTTAPTIIGTPKVISSTLVEVGFSAGAYGMNKESLENVENYTIEGLKVTEAKAYDLNEDYLYETVLLVTEEQELNKSYKLTVTGVTDDSVLKNVIKSKTLSFRGMRADKTAPAVISVDPKNANEVEILFNETGAMGIASMTDLANYKITYKDAGQEVQLAVLEAEAWADEYPDAYDNAYKGVTLKTEEQDTKVTYTIKVSNVEDEYGNAMKSAVTRTFKGSQEDVKPPTVKSVKNTDKGIVIEFADDSALKAATVKDATNYTINGGIGTAISASYKASTKTVTLTTAALTANKSYNVIIDNIEDEYGNLMPSRTVSFVAIATSLDTTAPSFGYAYAENSSEVHISFDEAITTSAGSIVLEKDSNNVVTLALTYSGKINDGTTVVYKVTTGALDNKTYKFPASTNFADSAGNAVDIKDQTFVGVKGVNNDTPKVEYVEQINAKTVIVSFSESVKITSVTSPAATGTGAISKVEGATANTHVTEWKIVFDGKLKYGDKFTLKTDATDLSGVSVAAAGYEFTADYYDDVAPSIIGVTATNSQTIVVEYDEDLERAGTYEIYYINAAGTKVKTTHPGSVVTTARNKVTVSYNTKGSEIYYLTAKVGAEDYANNREKANDGEWDFIGSDVQITQDYITGVSIINAKSIKVTANYKMDDIVVYEVYGAEDNEIVAVAVYDATSSSSATFNVNVPLLAGMTYRVVEGQNKFEFKGVTPDLGLKLVKDGASYKVTSYDGNLPENHTAVVKTVAGTQVALNAVAGDVTYYIEVTNTITNSLVYAAKYTVPVTPAP